MYQQSVPKPSSPLTTHCSISIYGGEGKPGRNSPSLVIVMTLVLESEIHKLDTGSSGREGRKYRTSALKIASSC